jgi:hypothetical protein
MKLNSWLMLFNEELAIYSENRTKHTKCTML